MKTAKEILEAMPLYQKLRTNKEKIMKESWEKENNKKWEEAEKKLREKKIALKKYKEASIGKITNSQEVAELIDNSQVLFVGHIHDIDDDLLSITDSHGYLHFPLCKVRREELQEDFKISELITVKAQIKKNKAQRVTELHIIKLEKA